MAVIDIKLTPSRRDLSVFAVLCLVFFPVFGWIMPAMGSSLLIIAGATGLCSVISFVFNSEQTAREKKFGAVIPFLLLGLWAGSSIQSTAIRPTFFALFSAIGVILFTVVLISPSRGAAIYRGWMYAALPIGWTTSYVLLGIAYFLVVTPIGLVLRVFKRDSMCRAFEPKAKTYWIPRKRTSDRRQYFRQF